MPRVATTPQKEDRLSIRADANQKSMLARAARAQHMNVSQFVLQASLSAAQRVIEEESRIVVSPEEYEWLCKVMDEPATPAPRLGAALAQKPVWDD
ncbi:hypothetical protein IAD21_01777 [Abditibacteriota bacterium]|nr:hypothetical protein IAD21_01777 [Abditibacteriota bacterium]